MTADEFRRLALRMDGATEGAHMGHPDFRANRRIFATLYPDNKRGMVHSNLTNRRISSSWTKAPLRPPLALGTSGFNYRAACPC
jgi:hypothetical protein